MERCCDAKWAVLRMPLCSIQDAKPRFGSLSHLSRRRSTLPVGLHCAAQQALVFLSRVGAIPDLHIRALHTTPNAAEAARMMGRLALAEAALRVHVTLRGLEGCA